MSKPSHVVNFITKDSGKRQDYDSGMVRDTQSGKPMFNLINAEYLPYEETLIYRWAMLMTRGAGKYSLPIEKYLNLYQLLLFISEQIKWEIVYDTKIELYTQKDIVGAVTKKDSGKTTQRLLNDNLKIEEIGQKEIQNVLKLLQRNEEPILKKEQEIKELNGLKPLGKGDLQKRLTYFYWNNKKIGAQFVKRFYVNTQNILTMTIQQGSQEVIYVMGATEVWGCLKTLWRVLKKQFNILKKHQLNSLSKNNYQLITNNDRNWEKADSPEEMSRFKESAFRHFMQAITGQDDEDHWAAVLFNINAIISLQWKLANE